MPFMLGPLTDVELCEAVLEAATAFFGSDRSAPTDTRGLLDAPRATANNKRKERLTTS